MQWILVLAVSVFMLAGCSGMAYSNNDGAAARGPGPGGSGGSAVGVGGNADDDFLVVEAKGGAGGDGTVGGSGHDGCDVMSNGPDFTMCNTGFHGKGGTVTVTAVNHEEPMAWADLRLTAEAEGFTISSGDAALPLSSNFDLSSLLEGDIQVGQSFTLCGPTTLHFGLADVRPFGASVGVLANVPQCDGTPWRAPDMVLEHDYALQVSGPHMTALGFFSKNCGGIPDGVTSTLKVTAKWSAQTPLAGTLQFRLWDGAKKEWGQPVEGSSPFEHTFESNGIDPEIGVFLVSPNGASIEQDVALHVDGTFHGRPAHLYPDEPSYCAAP